MDRVAAATAKRNAKRTSLATCVEKESSCRDGRLISVILIEFGHQIHVRGADVQRAMWKECGVSVTECLSMPALLREAHGAKSGSGGSVIGRGVTGVNECPGSIEYLKALLRITRSAVSFAGKLFFCLVSTS